MQIPIAQKNKKSPLVKDHQNSEWKIYDQESYSPETAWTKAIDSLSNNTVLSLSLSQYVDLFINTMQGALLR